MSVEKVEPDLALAILPRRDVDAVLSTSFTKQPVRERFVEIFGRCKSRGVSRCRMLTVVTKLAGSSL